MNLYSADPQTLTFLCDVMGAGVIVFDVNDHHEVTALCTNDVFHSLYGNHEGISNRLPEELADVFVRHARDCSRQLTPIDFEHSLERGKQWMRVRMIPVCPELEVDRVRIFATTVDIPSKQQLEEDLQVANARLNSVIDSSFEGVVTIDMNRNIKSFNQAACRIFGYEPSEVIGQPLEKLIPERFRPRHQGYVQQFQKSNDRVRPMESRAEVRALRKDGSELNAEVSIAKISVGDELEFTAFIRDISEHVRVLDELHCRATTDPLTGLNNRRHTTEEAQKELLRARRFSRPTTAMLIDIDDFKSINDIYGHHVGDRVLQEAGKICKGQARQTDIVARWGGEELLLFLPETDMVGAKHLAQRVLDELRGIHKAIDQLDNRQVTASIGISEFGDDGDTLDFMINRADQAMYVAKNNGKNKIVTTV